MEAASATPTIVAVLQAGGVLGFALVVYLELRRQGEDRKAERKAEADAREQEARVRADEAKETRQVLQDLAGDIRAMLERDRMRGETPHRGVPRRARTDNGGVR